MKFAYSIKTALMGISTHKSRSALTVLGIVIGITAIMIVMSLGQGAQELILAQIQGMGTKTIVVIPGREPSGPSDAAQVLSDSLKEKDLAALQRKINVPDATRVMPLIMGGESSVYGNETYRLSIFGGSPAITDLFDLEVSEGVFFTEEDVKSRAGVVVIGSRVRQELFGEQDPIGERIRIKNHAFRVIGVLPEKGQVSFFNFDETAIVPYTTAQDYIFGINYFHRFVVEASSENVIATTVEDIKQTLRDSHNITDPDKDDFFVQTQADLAARLGSITSVLTAFLASVAAISLLVGGIGIMNIMLVSVTERTKEIGLRKALGARDRDILLQFLLEAIMLTVVGGIIGITLGALLTLMATFALNQFLALGWTFVFPINAAILGMAVAGGVGMIFGLYPARKASQKSPVEALRYE